MSGLTGQSLGRYHILEQLGEGGMATVYKAYDTRLERDVAIKIIRRKAFPEEQLDRILTRFEREAKSLARLTHTNIVSVIDYGEYEDAPYLVMEYLPGGTLKSRLGTRMPWQEAISILLPIAQALAYAHAHNIIHRDIKPSNILLTENGQPMLSDFGIAKILESAETQTLTGTGVGIGTPEYMAPEQWTGQAGPQSDLYSLGVVLYELVTGRKPYTADTPAAIMLKQANDPLPRPRQFVPDIPEAVEKVLYKSLAKDPKNRYQSMVDFAAALEQLMHEKAVEKKKTAIFSRPVPESDLVEKKPGLEPAGSIDNRSTLSPTAGSVEAGKPVLQPGSPIPPPPPVKMKRKGMPGWGVAVIVLLVLAIVVWGGMSLISKPQHTPTLMPTAYGGGSGKIAFYSSVMRNGGIFIINADGSDPRLLTNNDIYDRGQTWSPDGSKIAFLSERDGKYEIYVMDVDGSDKRNLTNNAANDSGIAWSPDGSKIAFNSDRNGNGEIYVMNADGSDPRNLTNSAENDNSPAWSPDGSKIAFPSERGDGTDVIFVINADGSEPRQLTDNDTYDIYPTWSPDGSKIAFISLHDGNREIYVVNPDGSDQRNLTNSAADDFGIAWSPDGSKIAFYSILYKTNKYTMMINVMDADGSDQQKLTSGPWNDAVPAWSPDGSKLAFWSDRDDANGGIYVMNADGSDPRRLTTGVGFDSDPAWSP